jgi:hypothetical protein
MYQISRMNHYRLFGFVYLFAIYALGIFSYGIWSDDFPTLIDPHSHAIHAIRDGRPVYGWLIELLYNLFGTIDSLKFVRLFGFLGLALLNDLVLKKLLEKDESLSVLVATLVAFSVPSFQFSSHWGVAFGISWSAYLGVLGLSIFTRFGLIFKLLGLASVTVSLLIYPLMTYFVVSFTFAKWLLESRELSKLCSHLFKSIQLLVGGTLISFTIAKFVLVIYGLDFNPRVELVSFSGIVDKVVWFTSRPFVLSYRPFFIDSPDFSRLILQIAPVVAIILVLYYLKFRKPSSVFFQLVAFNLSIVLSLTPLIVTSQNQIDLRFLSSSSWLVVFVFLYLLLSRIKNSDKKSRKLWFLGFIYCVLGLGAFSVNSIYYNYISKIEYSTREFLTSEIRKCDKTLVSQKISIVPRTKVWESKPLLGIYSQPTDLASEWVPIPAVTLFAREVYVSPDFDPIVEWGSTKSSGCLIYLDNF